MHLEAVIKRVWTCTWRRCSCELGSHNQTSLEIHLEAVIERVWRCTLEAVIEQVWRCTLEAVTERDSTSTHSRSMDDVPGAETLLIS